MHMLEAFLSCFLKRVSWQVFAKNMGGWKTRKPHQAIVIDHSMSQYIYNIVLHITV